jgi:uncharacterized protein DUF6968
MTLVAGRTLKLQRDNAELDIAIRVFAPEQEGTACSCRYEIDWPEGRQIMNAWGDDSIQALLIAFQMIGADIYSSAYHKVGLLRFSSPGNGYGFPVVPTLRNLLVGDDIKIFG